MHSFSFPQTIELERGEAFHLYLAVGTAWRNANQPMSQPLDLGLLLALPLLERLGKRLLRLHQAEQQHVGKPARKLRAFRLSCEEVAVVTKYVLPAGTLLAQRVLGKVQQKSLNLTAYVTF